MGVTGSFFAVYFLSVVAATAPVSVIVHELGHALAGYLSGYRVSGMRILCVSISFGRGVALSRNTSGIKGQCLVFDEDGSFGRNAGATVLGGCAANLFAACLCALMLFACDGIYAMTALISGAVINLVFALSNLIPSGSNDGATFAEIMRFGSENYNKLMNIASAREMGMNYRDMDPDWFVPSTVGGSMAIELHELKRERKSDERGYRFAG